MAVVSSTRSARRSAPTAARNGRRHAAPASPYRPYQLHGEAILLVCLAVAGILWLLVPAAFVIKLLGAVALLLVLPAVLIPEYWPKLQMHDLGWQSPERPRLPNLYSLVVIVVSFFPLALWLFVAQPEHYVAVAAGNSWIGWLFGHGILALLFVTQAAFFTGILLFRMAHLIQPWLAIILVGLVLGIANLLIPGPVRYFALPLTVALAWMAWQTRSFVPPAVTMISLTLIYDLIVRLT